MIKKYCKIIFQLESPLTLGNGENQITDSDVVKDSRGIPYVPATSLTGVYRQLLKKDQAERYFGKLLELTNDLTESKVIVYDANVLRSEQVVITKRDMVKLDENKIACDGAKFDFQIVEPGIAFVTYIEQDIDSSDEDITDEIANAWIAGNIMIGAKTTRGYGRTKADVKDIQIKTFHMDQAQDVEAWLDFDVFDENTIWDDYQPTEPIQNVAKYTEIKLVLQQKGGVFIRQYSTDVNKEDYRQVALDNKTPIIPGTSWAGAFRHHMRKLGYDEKRQKTVFGTVEKNSAEKSVVRFTESQISGGVDLVYMRNSIDRFTGGTIKGALYKEKSHYNGKLELIISFDTEKCDEEFRQYLAASIMDLHDGYLAVGGLTSVGKGMFEIEKIYVDQIQLEHVDYQSLSAAIL